MVEPRWLDWATRLQAIAQDALAYTTNPFDIERFKQVREIAVEMLAAETGADPEPVRALFADEVGYATPKIDVRAACFREGRILLVQEHRDGLWTLPGGWADVGDSPREAVEREVWEESGFRARAIKLVAVYDRRKHPHPPHIHHIWKLFFLCELTGGEPRTSIETDAVAFFAEDDLPPLSLPRVTPEQIHRLFEHQRHLDWPTEFD